MTRDPDGIPSCNHGCDLCEQAASVGGKVSQVFTVPAAPSLDVEALLDAMSVVHRDPEFTYMNHRALGEAYAREYERQVGEK